MLTPDVQKICRKKENTVYKEVLLYLSTGHTKSFVVVFGTDVVGILLKLLFNDVVAFLQSFLQPF